MILCARPESCCGATYQSSHGVGKPNCNLRPCSLQISFVGLRTCAVLKHAKCNVSIVLHTQAIKPAVRYPADVGQPGCVDTHENSARELSVSRPSPSGSIRCPSDPFILFEWRGRPLRRVDVRRNCDCGSTPSHRGRIARKYLTRRRPGSRTPPREAPPQRRR